MSGHGSSEGEIDEDLLQEDILAIINTQKENTRNIVNF